MDILLTFTGFHDPYSVGLVGQEEQEGPILSLMRVRPFDRVVLFATPNTARNTAETHEAILAQYSGVEVDVRSLSLADPTNYGTILHGLRPHIRDVLEDYPGANYYIAVASGTPQMHACWVLLAASGEMPARILHVRPHRFVTKDSPVVSEVDVTSPEFPRVRSNVGYVEPDSGQPPDLAAAVQRVGIVGDHPSLIKALEVSAALAPSDVPIMILGQTGTGKELFARLIHYLSGRQQDQFVPLNCAAIPKELVESALFGHKKGSFTGAVSDQTGKFDAANGGTLFLDELAELPLATQGKLLRVLQDGMVEPVGGREAHEVNVRVVAATNKDILAEVRAGRFREDLYYRLNTGVVEVPSLRERRSDIPKLALHILDRVNASLRKPKRLSPSALTRLQNHAWPGNVRDLENVIQRSALLARRDLLEADDLMISEPEAESDPLAALPVPCDGFALDRYLSSARKQLILRALEQAEGNQSKAARLLGISPQAVHKFLRQEGTSFNQS